MKLRYMRFALASFTALLIFLLIRTGAEWSSAERAGGAEPQASLVVLERSAPNVEGAFRDPDNKTAPVSRVSGSVVVQELPLKSFPPPERLLSAQEVAVAVDTRPVHRPENVVPRRDNLLVILSKSPVGGPGPRETRMAAILQTWGRLVPVVFLTLNATRDSEVLKRRGIERMTLWQLPVEDHRERYFQARAMQYAFTKAAGDPNLEWIFWGNDHTYVIPGNLRCLLQAHNPGEYNYIGHRLNGPCCGDFNSGAAGFALSRRAIDTLLGHWTEAAKADHAPVKACDFRRKGSELAPCLKELTNGTCVPEDVRDPEDNAEKFHLYGVVRVAKGAIDDWAKRKKAALSPPEHYTDPPSSACCSKHTVSFHYVAADETRVLHAAFHDMSAADRAKLTTADWAQLWPRSNRLGGYSAPWPGRRPSDAGIIAKVLSKKIQILEPSTCSSS